MFFTKIKIPLFEIFCDVFAPLLKAHINPVYDLWTWMC
jgi:hypothetical protein